MSLSTHTSITNASIPAISGDLRVNPNQGTWTITSFAVANAIAVPLTRWLNVWLNKPKRSATAADAGTAH